MSHQALKLCRKLKVIHTECRDAEFAFDPGLVGMSEWEAHISSIHWNGNTHAASATRVGCASQKQTSFGFPSFLWEKKKDNKCVRTRSFLLYLYLFLLLQFSDLLRFCLSFPLQYWFVSHLCSMVHLTILHHASMLRLFMQRSHLKCALWGTWPFFRPAFSL